jgi:hypothetical protein
MGLQHLGRALFLLLVIMLCGCRLLQADELESLLGGFEDETSSGSDDELEGLLGGFSDPEAEQSEALPERDPRLPDWLTLQGSLSLQSTINFAHNAPEQGQPDYRGLSMFMGHGELIADATFFKWKARIGGTAFYDAAYQLNDQRDLYTDKYLSKYENELELNEAYLKGSLSGNIDLKLGRQIVVWGKSDNLRVTDILNPLDRRYPGMLDIRYLRLPVTMTRLDYFWNRWNISAMLIHEPRFAKFPVYNSEFFPGSRPPPRLETQDWSWDNQQGGVALNGIFSGWDLSFYAASVFQERAYVDVDPVGILFRTHDRATMFGTAANIVLGSWLVKGEAAYWDGLKYSNAADQKSRFDILAGVDYMGFSETTISFEIANRHIIDYDPLMKNLPDGQREDWTQYALRFVKDFMNDTLHLTFLLSSYGLLGAEGGFERFQLEYDISDNITVMGGVVFYESGDFPGFKDIGSNDRLLFELEYRF